jgi:serine/threonine protein kinase
MAADIAEGLYYLQCCSFVVGDLAARSVLVSRDYTCKIADFGLERDVTDRHNAAAVIHEPWAAPELLPEDDPGERAAWRRSGDSGVELPPGMVIDMHMRGLDLERDHRAKLAASADGLPLRCFTQYVVSRIFLLSQPILVAG